MYTGVSKDSTDAVIEALTRQPVSIAETDQISFPFKKTSLRTHRRLEQISIMVSSHVASLLSKGTQQLCSQRDV